MVQQPQVDDVEIIHLRGACRLKIEENKKPFLNDAAWNLMQIELTMEWWNEWKNAPK